MSKIVNLTPHALNMYLPSGEVFAIPSSGIATVNSRREPIDLNLPVPASKPTMGEIKGLPSGIPDTFYFVSALVRTSLPERKDLISPSTDRDDYVRDTNGQILGIKAFDCN